MANHSSKHETREEYGREICFGLDRVHDERSLSLFVKRLAQDQLLETLIPRLEDEEIEAIVNFVTGILKKHITHKEYHAFFLDDQP